MSDFGGEVRTICRIDDDRIAAIEGLLEAEPNIWEASDPYKPNRRRVFTGNTQHIVFKFPRTIRTHWFARFLPAWNERWQSAIQPIIDVVTPTFGFERPTTGRIMLARLRAGAVIPLHTDEDGSAKIPRKVHVPIITNSEVHFLVNDNAYHLERGIAYEVNNRVFHGGRNASKMDRVHLIFDCFDDSKLLSTVRAWVA